MLASRGVNPFRIQALGRWRSPLVVHYAGESLATGIAADVEWSVAGGVPNAVSLEIKAIKEFLARLEERLTVVETAEAEHPEPVGAAIEHTGRGSPALAPTVESYVINRETDAVHRTNTAADAPAAEQRSLCGWRFGVGRAAARSSRSWYLRADAIPTGTAWTSICRRCCNIERALAKREQGGLSDID